ncbi:MAG: effector binding domain-containing protein [Tepidisphaeraceae bacterium]
MRFRSVAGIAALLGLAVLAFARQPSTQPSHTTAKPGGDNDYVISAMRVQEMKGITFLYVSAETNYGAMHQTVTDAMSGFEEAIKAGKFSPDGATLFIYHGASQDPNKNFTLEMGFPVAEDTKPFGDYKVKKLDAFKCATVLYSGAVANIGQAYQQVFSELFQQGLKPTGETREFHFMWEGPESPNNVSLIQVGVE